ncbi:MAG: PHB depolymerase family esterase [Phycisphaerales bacterium]
MTGDQDMLDRIATAALTTAMLAAPAVAQDAAGQDSDRARAIRAFERTVQAELPVPGPAADAAAVTTTTIDFGRGPVTVYIPAGYDPAVPTSLVILLHGYMNTGQDVEDWLQFSALVDELNFLYLHPTGDTDAIGNPYWNATDACCDLFGEGTDDSSYLRDVVETMQTTFNVDDRSIHFAGHSNGGFMSYRMACDHADLVASVLSLAGATHIDPADCSPDEPVHVLQVHGTADGVISFGGGCIPFSGCYPSAMQTAAQWANFGGCDPAPMPGPINLDLVANLPGAETTVTQYIENCADGGSAELWTIPGAPHSPAFTPAARRLFVEHLLAHRKPAPCPGDIDGDGDVALGDLLVVLASWGPCSGCSADLDGDGAVTLLDLLTVLANFGACG